MRLLLIRHAESAGNAARIIQGTTDPPLTPTGERQAELLAARLAAGPRLDALYSSPLQRARHTADAIARACGISVRPLDGVREYDFGIGNGMPLHEARRHYAVPATAADAHLVFPGEEGRAAFSTRVSDALRALEQSHLDEYIVVVAHGGPIAAFLLAALGLPDQRRTPFRIQNASISTLDLRAGVATILGVNDRCHLEGSQTLRH